MVIYYIQLYHKQRYTTYIIQCTVSCILLVTPYILYQYYVQSMLCNQSPNNKLPSELCNSAVPLGIYNYIQNKYWNVGLFNYYTIKQIPNFILAGPILYITYNGISDYIYIYVFSN